MTDLYSALEERLMYLSIQSYFVLLNVGSLCDWIDTRSKFWYSTSVKSLPKLHYKRKECRNNGLSADTLIPYLSRLAKQTQLKLFLVWISATWSCLLSRVSQNSPSMLSQKGNTSVYMLKWHDYDKPMNVYAYLSFLRITRSFGQHTHNRLWSQEFLQIWCKQFQTKTLRATAWIFVGWVATKCASRCGQ